MSNTRTSIRIPGLELGTQPVPNAARIGHFVATGPVWGVDASKGEVPRDCDGQTRLMFANLQSIIEAAGGRCEEILKVTIWIGDSCARDTINKYWVQMFPDEQSRPARHVMSQPLQGGLLVQCEALAVVS